MFYYDNTFNTMYHITRKSAKEGLIKIITSRVNSRFNSEVSQCIIDEIMNNISIPNEYQNDRCIYMSVDESHTDGIRFSITASEVIKCKNPETGGELIPIPLPKYKAKKDYSNYLPLDSSSILNELAEANIKNGVIKQKGDFSNITFSVNESYENLISDVLKLVFNRAYSAKIANVITRSVSSESQKFFVYRLNNNKPVIYEVSRNAIKPVDAEEKLSAESIKKIIQLYTKEIISIEKEINDMSNCIHNMILYDISYGDEELSNPYSYKCTDTGIKFCFRKTEKGIDFLFRPNSSRSKWISGYINAPLKDITWTSLDVVEHYAPKYKGFRLTLPEENDCLNRAEGKIYIDYNHRMYVYSSLHHTALEGNKTKVDGDTMVSFRVAIE